MRFLILLGLAGYALIAEQNLPVALLIVVIALCLDFVDVVQAWRTNNRY